MDKQFNKRALIESVGFASPEPGESSARGHPGESSARGGKPGESSASGRKPGESSASGRKPGESSASGHPGESSARGGKPRESSARGGYGGGGRGARGTSGVSTANPSRPEPIEGRVHGGQYHIDRSSFGVHDIEHGWIVLPTTIAFTQKTKEFKVDASFLYFETEEKAIEVHSNLLQLKGESFLRSHFVIKNQMDIEDKTDPWKLVNKQAVLKPHICFWVAVEKIDNTLEKYKDFKQRFFGTRLCSQYQNIIRDIIRGMCEIHQQKYTHGNLKSKHVMIIKDRAKFAFITNGNRNNSATDFIKLKQLFEDVLGKGQNNPELTHFYQVAVTNHWMTLRKLYFHPLLLSSGERFQLPLMAYTRIQYREHGISVQKHNFRSLFVDLPQWKDKVTGRQDGYQTVVDSSYKDKNPWDLFEFVRNTIVHINENIRKKNEQRSSTAQPIQIKKEETVVEDLTSMFPYFLNKVYQFLELKEITPSLRW